MVWLASADLSIDPFKALPLVLCESTNWWHDAILSSLRGAGWEWRVVFESASLDATLAALEAGMGVSALLQESGGNSRIKEVKYARLPVLPEARFGLFRTRTTPPTRARALIEAALATSIRAAIGSRLSGGDEPQGWLSDDPLQLSESSQVMERFRFSS